MAAKAAILNLCFELLLNRKAYWLETTESIRVTCRSKVAKIKSSSKVARMDHRFVFSFLKNASVEQTVCVFYWFRHVRFCKLPATVQCRKRYHKLLALLLAGIEPNPGPTPKFPCGVCSSEVEYFGARAFACNTCDTLRKHTYLNI